MKLQVALDLIDGKKAIKIAKQVKDYVDIIELGTPLIKKEGLSIVKKFKKFKKPILVDLKTMDTGALEAELAFKSGANITSVCASANLKTVKDAIKTARKYRKKILVDLIGIKNKLQKAKQIAKLKPDYICVHTAIDVQKQKNPFNDFKKISKAVKTKLAIAGGINLKNISKILKIKKPEIIIIGGAITKSKNPKLVAKKIRNEL